ncbi:MAG: tripartite tricarboxylate transporter substrate binding protein [Variovorax sp.]|nr:tripartite tricarboxylate transporter substrate binding protein [Variovorax sp.]
MHRPPERHTRRQVVAAALSLPLAALAPRAWAQDTWPSRPVKLVVPFPPGGGTDVLARLLAERLRPLLGQPVVIDNRPGATGNIGNEVVAKSPPDGYTLLMQGTIIGMFPHIFQKLGYDPLKDLTAVGMVAESPYVIVANLDSAYKTLPDIVSAAKANPSKPLPYATAGVGSPSHLAMEQLANLAGIRLEHITYRGTAPALNDLLAGTTQFGSYSLSSLLGLIQSNKVRVIAVMTAKRSPLLPETPGMAELGFPDVDSSIRFGLFTAAGTPPDLIAKLAAFNARATADPALRDAFVKAGYGVVTSTPKEMQAMVQQEYKVWGPIVQRLGLKPE